MNLHNGVSVSLIKRSAYSAILFHDDPAGRFIDRYASRAVFAPLCKFARFSDADSKFTAIFNEALKINERIRRRLEKFS